MRPHFLLLFFSLRVIYGAQNGYYKAAVAEYTPVGSVYSQTPSEVIRQNLALYASMIQEAALQGTDIIVFPEYGITTLGISSFSRSRARPFLQELPPLNTSASSTTCSNASLSVPDDQLVFSALSCLAQRHSIYIVANLGEIVYCAPGQNTSDGDVCYEDGACQFSTNAVFDREGRLIARYRKTHLFGEPLYQYPAIPDHSTFVTDFGVKFGLMICFDIMFYEPGLSLYYDEGIRHFAFPTAWVDELPFLTAPQIQEGWSRFLGINLLASGYHLPANGQLGSGLYGPSGPVNYTFNPESGTVLVSGELSIDLTFTESLGNTEESAVNRWVEPHGMLYEDLTNYSNIELNVGGNQSAFLCHDNLCCSFAYSSDCPTKPCDVYRLFTYSGYRTLGGGMYTVAIQLCGVIACSDRTTESCAKSTVKNTAAFSSFQLIGNFSDAKQVFPTATTKELQLLPADSFQLNIGTSTIELNSSKPLLDLLAIGLYGRAYDKDING